ncbi:hypothetical protein [Tateyamaria sp. SN6-1]|uniref:hypothetical protein n=1 Tax=Tateyamaria sp. SN6-1 TaxID=3092148 RepID=UPI0039F58949
MIGDSHLTMMLEANKAFYSDKLEIAPITWPRQYVDQFAFSGTELMAQGDALAHFWKGCGLNPTVDAAQFDAVVFVSRTVTAFNIFTILQDYVVSNWNGARDAIKSLKSMIHSPSNRRLMTPAAFEECMIGIIQSDFTYRIAAQLREHCTVPIFVVPPPYLAERTLKHRPHLTGLKRILHNDDGSVFAESYTAAHHSAFARIPDVSVLTQPDQTVTRGCLTKETYRAGAKRFGTDDAHREDDVMHAGPAFGKLCLDRITAAMAEL